MDSQARRFLFLLSGLTLVAGCRLLTGTGDLVIDDNASGGGSSTDDASSASGTTSSSGAGGNGGSTASTTTGSTTTTGAGGGGVSSCAEYCNALESQCSDASLQYDTKANCLDYCPYLAESSDPNTDTLACRAKFLPPNALDCVAAGPGGAGKCGDPCQNFCVRALFICPGSYVDLDDCTTFCATLPDVSLTTYAAPASLDDTLSCRLYFLTREVSAPTVFCASLGQDSNNCL